MASKKVDAIDINSGAMARVGMDALIVAGALEARGIETVPHLTTRDQNIIGCKLRFSARGPSAASATFLAITGDPRPSATTRKPAAYTKSTPSVSSKFGSKERLGHCENARRLRPWREAPRISCEIVGNRIQATRS